MSHIAKRFATFIFSLTAATTGLAQSIDLNFFNKKVSVNLQLSNRSGEEAIVRISVVKPDGRVEFAKDKIVPNGQTATWVERLSVGSKLNWNYALPSLSASFELPARTIIDGSSQEIVEVASALEKYDDASAVAKLKQIATQLDLDKNPIQLKKAQEQMGLLWIGDADGKQIGAGWRVKDVEISGDGTIRFDNTVSIEGKSALSAAANIPLIAQMQAAFESGQIYKVIWKAEHFTFRNVGMDDQLPKIKVGELKQILASLKQNVTSKLCYIYQAKVLKYVAHSVTKGTKVNFSGSFAKSTLFTSNGSYMFDASETSLSAFTDQVVKVEPVCLQRNETLNFIEYQITASEKATIEEPPPAVKN